jgi:hypothetical protein
MIDSISAVVKFSLRKGVKSCLATSCIAVSFFIKSGLYTFGNSIGIHKPPTGANPLKIAYSNVDISPGLFVE